MRKTLIAKDGYILTNGDAFVRVVDLAEGDNGEKWHKITEEEYFELKQQEDEKLLQESINA